MSEREMFEAWIQSNGGCIDRIDGGEYRSAPTECAWDAWQARAQAAQTPDTCPACSSSSVQSATVHVCDACGTEWSSKFNSGCTFSWKAQTPDAREPVAQVVTIAQGRNAGKQVALLRDVPNGSYIYTSPQPVPAGWKLVPIEPTTEMINAMASSRARDVEELFDHLCDLIGYSGDNKTRTVLCEAYSAMLAAAPLPLESKGKS